ncbi:IclR family transcriptional regulator [Amycolatopsis regifaucium]|uniref:IclR family transcriptional regulator n=1 Tax=Amycolatopsis regifaucium TaxID=546365 RepID=A0A154MEZ1_9PSEU|nr:IclR family transcriptional regulator [Amycolatopsis regifaucium]KZB83042.1 IclR family transcriptional regulator [Amycolatopsis regifaucium]OKA03440.1 IclR family transcriptional regulator [Amycolatopsis regifaucium]
MPPRSRSTSTYRERNSTADRALDILLLYSPDKPVWTGAEIAAELGVARSTGYRYIQSLVRTGFLEETAGGLRLGPRIFQLARSARIGLGLSEVALPVMRDLAAAVGETVLLTRRSGRSVVCLDLVEAPHAVRLSYERGHVLPINAGAAAEVLLAWADSREVTSVLAQAPLERFSARTLTDPDELRTRLAGIRKRGVAISRGELDEHILGVAAPIRDSSGKVCAAISIAALAARVPRSRLSEVESAVRDAAAAITGRLELLGN